MTSGARLLFFYKTPNSTQYAKFLLCYRHAYNIPTSINTTDTNKSWPHMTTQSTAVPMLQHRQLMFTHTHTHTHTHVPLLSSCGCTHMYVNRKNRTRVIQFYCYQSNCKVQISITLKQFNLWSSNVSWIFILSLWTWKLIFINNKNIMSAVWSQLRWNVPWVKCLFVCYIV